MCGIIKSVKVLFVNEQGSVAVSGMPKKGDTLVKKASLSI